jgi:hypothetical protein
MRLLTAPVRCPGPPPCWNWHDRGRSCDRLDATITSATRFHAKLRCVDNDSVFMPSAAMARMARPYCVYILYIVAARRRAVRGLTRFVRWEIAECWTRDRRRAESEPARWRLHPWLRESMFYVMDQTVRSGLVVACLSLQHHISC